MAGRERNPKLENLYDELKRMNSPSGKGRSGAVVSEAIEREINMMGFADYTVPTRAKEACFADKERLFAELENRITVSGAEAFFKLRFRHMPP